MKTRKNRGGNLILENRLNECVSKNKVLTEKLQKKEVEFKDFINYFDEFRKENNLRFDALDKKIVQLEGEIVDLKAENVELKSVIVDLKAEIVDLQLVKNKYVNSKMITALYDVIKTEKHTIPKSKLSDGLRQRTNPAYENVHQQKLGENRHKIDHYFLDNVLYDKPKYDMYKKHLYDRIRELQEQKSPLVEYINRKIMDISANIDSQVFDLDTFMSILESDIKNVVITPKIKQEIDEWW
jgi:chromosome segregation ATPase